MQRAGADGGAAGVGVICGKREGAGAVLGERTGAADGAGEGEIVGAIDGEGGVVGDVANEGAGGAAVAELERAGADGGAAGVGVVAGEGDGVGADLGDRTGAAGVVLDDAGEGRVHVVMAEREGRATAGRIADGNRPGGFERCGVPEIANAQTGLIHHGQGIACLVEQVGGSDAGAIIDRQTTGVANVLAEVRLGRSAGDEGFCVVKQILHSHPGADVAHREFAAVGIKFVDQAGGAVEHEFALGTNQVIQIKGRPREGECAGADFGKFRIEGQVIDRAGEDGVGVVAADFQAVVSQNHGSATRQRTDLKRVVAAVSVVCVERARRPEGHRAADQGVKMVARQRQGAGVHCGGAAESAGAAKREGAGALLREVAGAAERAGVGGALVVAANGDRLRAEGEVAGAGEAAEGCVEAVEVEAVGGVVDDGVRGELGGGAEEDPAAVDGEVAGEGVGAGEAEHAGAVLGDAAVAADGAGEGEAGVGAIEGQGAAAAGGDVAEDGAGGAAVAELERAGADGGAAGVGVVAREGEGAGAGFGEAAVAAEDAGVGGVGVVGADGEGLRAEGEVAGAGKAAEGGVEAVEHEAVVDAEGNGGVMELGGAVERERAAADGRGAGVKVEGAREGEVARARLGHAAAAGDGTGESDVVGAVEGDKGAAGYTEIALDGAGGAAIAELEGAVVDGGSGQVGIGMVAGEGEGAGAVLGEAAVAADCAGVGGVGVVVADLELCASAAEREVAGTGETAESHDRGEQQAVVHVHMNRAIGEVDAADGLDLAGVDERIARKVAVRAQGQHARAFLGQSAGAADDPEIYEVIRAIEDEGAVVDDIAEDGAGGAAVAELEGAGADGGGAGVEVVGGEDGGAGARLLDRAVAADDAGVGGGVGTVEDQGGAAAGGDVAGDAAGGAAGAELEGAGAERGRARVKIVGGEDEGAGAGFGEPGGAAGVFVDDAADGEVRATGDGVGGVGPVGEIDGAGEGVAGAGGHSDVAGREPDVLVVADGVGGGGVDGEAGDGAVARAQIRVEAGCAAVEEHVVGGRGRGAGAPVGSIAPEHGLGAGPGEGGGGGKRRLAERAQGREGGQGFGGDGSESMFHHARCGVAGLWHGNMNLS